MELNVAFITGITGQDGSYLTELLLEKHYVVYGLVRRKANPEHATTNIDHLTHHGSLRLMHGDLLDSGNMSNIIAKVVNSHPDMQRFEIYNLGALSHVKVSFESPEYCMMVNAVGTLKLLECIRALPRSILHKVRFYQASTSELYGQVLEIPQSETTPFNPVSPYACSKLSAFYLVKNYRDGYGMHVSNGILFNHESPRRGMDFITRKITVGLAKILSGKSDCLLVGNLDSIRDWGHARDYVYGMWLMLQSDTPDDYVLATGETHSVREFITLAFKEKNIELSWHGEGVDEVAADKNGKVLVRVHPRYFRPVEVSFLQGNASKAEKQLGWRRKKTFHDLVREMVEADCS